MFTPGADCPMPLRYLDVHRFTRTSFMEKNEVKIDDYWDGTPNDNRELSEP